MANISYRQYIPYLHIHIHIHIHIYIRELLPGVLEVVGEAIEDGPPDGRHLGGHSREEDVRDLRARLSLRGRLRAHAYVRVRGMQTDPRRRERGV